MEVRGPKFVFLRPWWEGGNFLTLGLQAQQRYFSYRAIAVAIVSQKKIVLVFILPALLQKLVGEFFFDFS